MEWINVKDKHFANIEQVKTKCGVITKWESDMIDEPFMVAIPTNNGWCIEQVVLTDGVGLQSYTDDEGPMYFGWDITDVTHWMKLEHPKD